MSDLSVKSKNDEVLTPGQASRILKVNPRTLKRWASHGKIRESRLPSGHSRYYKNDILAIGTKQVMNESRKEKLSLLSIMVLLWLWIKGLIK